MPHPALRPLLLACTALACLAAPPRTLRVDYGHTGDAASERFGVDRVVLEPLPWPGDPAKAVDASNLGKYCFEVTDKATGKLLYSRGFASIYGEWETTDEAKAASRSFGESLRFPRPDAPVRITVKKRDERNAFKAVWAFDLDPADPLIEQAPAPEAGALIALQKAGEPAEKVDLLILGDGYTAAERGKFEAQARKVMEFLFAQPPFKEHRKDFNVWAICPASKESGISRPSTGVHRRTPLGTTYDAFGSERYVLTFDNRAWRDIAAQAPYEFVEILTNSETYGGGGIHNLYSTASAGNSTIGYLFVHEFGHHFAGLADEYYTSDVAITNSPSRPEPWEPNATADPKNPKWKALLTPGVPLPTPWKKDAFEAHSHDYQKERRAIRAANKPESDMDALFAREKVFETDLLGTDAHSGKVGAFEGANYEAKGYFRSQEDCLMFTRNDAGFCAACRAAIEKVIRQYAK
ncbi:IgA Peptidase M64 [Geothrix sp. 21YS21S-4]|uniref:IgA Peptidase M64 n=1 Tax=Geothrix sp. 21YS21S-4 TaxID=3068889 RepID=UPI0027BAD5B7|nr:IgA Peptidase M64 [Geothrix sp. 21YS21S-4]